MFDRDDVELALMALEEGWSMRAAGALVGASSASVSLWSWGAVPHEGLPARVGQAAPPRDARVGEGREVRHARGGARGAQEREGGYSSYAGEPSPALHNLPLRPDGTHLFSAPAPNRLWVTDITEFRLPCGSRACLSLVVDCFDGRPVAWSVGALPTVRLANSSLEAACATLAPGERPVVHYRWPGWIGLCRESRLVRSMSRKDMSCDNARMEGFFGTLKSEFFHARDWEGRDAGDFMVELRRWLKWFRSGCISGSPGWRTPDENRRLLGYTA